MKKDNWSLKLEEPCPRCGSYTYEIRKKGPHVGLYCKCCMNYIKWLSKEEKKKYGIHVVEDVSNGKFSKFTVLDDVPLNKEDDGHDMEVPW